MKRVEVKVHYYGHGVKFQEAHYEPSGVYLSARSVEGREAIERECSRIFGKPVSVKESITVGVSWVVYKAGPYDPAGGLNDPIAIYHQAIKSSIELTEYGKQYAPKGGEYIPA